MCKVKLNISHADFFWQFLAAASNAVHTGAFCSNFVWRKSTKSFFFKSHEDDYFAPLMISNRTCEFEIQVLAGANTKVLFTDHYT